MVSGERSLIRTDYSLNMLPSKHFTHPSDYEDKDTAARDPRPSACQCRVVRPGVTVRLLASSSPTARGDIAIGYALQLLLTNASIEVEEKFILIP